MLLEFWRYFWAKRFSIAIEHIIIFKYYRWTECCYNIGPYLINHCLDSSMKRTKKKLHTLLIKRVIILSLDQGCYPGNAFHIAWENSHCKELARTARTKVDAGRSSQEFCASTGLLKNNIKTSPICQKSICNLELLILSTTVIAQVVKRVVSYDNLELPFATIG